VILDLEKPGMRPSLDTQVCVVGAGAVGLSLAVALNQRGVDVVALEGGGESMENRSQTLQRGESVGHHFVNINVGRYRILGGTTTLWGGQVLPFDRFVTEARPWIGHSAWPVSASALEKYFARAYHLLGLDDVELDDQSVWDKLGVEAPNLGEGLDVVMTRWLRTRNFAKLYRNAIRDSGGPTVVVHANVVALEVAPSGAAQAVRARSLDGQVLTVRARHFVLANGTLEVVRLLKHPLHDGSVAPWAASRWLGSPLIDHLDCHAGDVKLLNHKRFHELFDNIFLGGRKYYPKIRVAPEVQRNEGLVDVAAQFSYRTRLSDHLAYLTMFLQSVREGGSDLSLWALPAHLAAVATTVVPLALRYFRDHRSFKPLDAEVSLCLFCEQLPTTRSRIGLSNETDALGMRRLRVDWQIDGRELKTMAFFGQQIKRQLEAQGLAEVALDPRLEDKDPSFLTAVYDAIHQMGTTRMGLSAEEGFVDADLRVFGTPNLYVAGAAVFPSTGFANPTFTAIALALRLADHLTDSLRASAYVC
jgi:choline dehydrogenase-like flavoprotein